MILKLVSIYENINTIVTRTKCITKNFVNHIFFIVCDRVYKSSVLFKTYFKVTNFA